MKRIIDDEESWNDSKDERPPAKLERRRHRDPEETDERRLTELRRHPRRQDGRPHGDGADG